MLFWWNSDRLPRGGSYAPQDEDAPDQDEYDEEPW
jgi:hypothetical protein